MDYFYIKDEVVAKESEHEDAASARTSMTCLCMQESLCGSVWGYALTQKGAANKWIVDQVADDIASIGMSQERIIV